MSEENRLPLQRLALVFCALSFFLFSFHLEEISLYHTDEQYYIQSCRNMADSGDWLTPVLNGEKRFAKPILFYWPVSLSFKIFGVGLASARLVSSLFGVLCLWVVFRMGTTLFGVRTGLHAVFILASSFLYFLSARIAYTDMALCFFITLSLYFFAKIMMEEGSRKEAGDRNVLFFYMAAGLATATKGLPGLLLPGLIIALYLWLTRDLGTARRFFNAPGILLFLTLSFFWPIAMAFLHGDIFMNHLVHAEGVDRILHTERPSFYFFLVLLRYFLPWSLFLLAAAFVAFGKERKLLRDGEKRQLFLWLWVGVPLILFTFFRIRHSRYMLPAAPALALLLGYYFHRLWERGAGSKDKGFNICFYSTVTLYLGIATLTFMAGCLLYYLRWEEVSPIIFLLPTAFLAGAGGMIYSRRKKDLTLLPFIIAFPLLVSFPLLAGKALPLLNPDPMMAFAANVNSGWKLGTNVGTYGLGNGNQRLRVLTGRPVKSLKTEESLSAFLQGEGPLFLVIREEDFHRLPESGKVHFGMAGEAKQWKKVKFNQEVWEQTKEEFAPGFQERFREKVFLIYKGVNGG